jgi:steroid delta-isomerase-like uncharacterized protein
MNRKFASLLGIGFTLLVAGLAASSAFAQADAVTNNKALVLAFVEDVLNGGNAENAGSYVTTDYIEHVPGTPSGIEPLQSSVSMLHTAFPDIHYTVLQIAAQDDLVAARIFITGTQEDDFMGIPAADSQRVAAATVNFWRVEDGLLAEHWEVLDSYAFLQQLGAIPGGQAATDALIPDETPITEVAEATTEPRLLTTNVEIVEEFFSEVINMQDLDAADDIMTETFVWNNAFVAPGLEGFKQFYPIIFEAFPDVQRTPELVVADGDLVFVLNTITGTHEGGEQLYGVPPTGNPINYASADIFRLEDGKIVELWDIADYLTLFTQIGLIPSVQ